MWRAELAAWQPRPSLHAVPVIRPDHGHGRRAATDLAAQTVDVAEFPSVYALYDSYQLLYIGQTGELGTRLKQHRDETRDLVGRWTTFSWLSPVALTYEPESDEQIRAERHDVQITLKEPEWREMLETFAIALAIPRINKQLTLSQLGRDFVELRQRPHSDAPSGTDALLEELIRRR